MIPPIEPEQPEPERLRPPRLPEPKRSGLPWWGWLIIAVVLAPILFVGFVFATCALN